MCSSGTLFLCTRARHIQKTHELHLIRQGLSRQGRPYAPSI